MPDWLSPEARSRIMRAIRAKNTKPEIVVRRYLFSAGYRYRLHLTQLPGRPDLVFTKRRKIVLVHGCFWHQHADRRCSIVGIPTSNTKYWLPKLQRNIERDRENSILLEGLGWRTLVVWECELRSNPEKACRKIAKFLGPTRSNPG